MKKHIILSILILISIGITCFYFFYFQYSPNNQKLIFLEKEINKIEFEIKHHEMNIQDLKKEISKMPLSKINLNYFNRQEIDNEEQVPYFLQLINRMTNNLSIKLLSVSPRSFEDKGDYIKNNFEIKLKGDYRKLVRFIYQIEYNLKFNLDSVSLSYLENTAFHELNSVEASLKINSLEMKNPKEREVGTLFELREQYISSSKEAVIKRPKKIARNPFIKPIKAKYARADQEKIDTTLKNLSIVGIMDFENKKRALINNKFVKEGDLLENQIIVLKINEATVTLGFQNKEYTLYMENNPVSIKQNSRRLIHE